MKKLIFIVFAIAIVVIAYLSIQNRKYKNSTQLQAVELATLQDSVLTYKTKTGELIAKISAVEVEKRNLKKSLETAGFDIRKLKEQDIKWRKITSALKLKLEATGSGETATVDTFYIKTDPVTQKSDTTTFVKIKNWTNNYLSLYNARVENSRFTFDYKYNTGIDLIIEGTRKVPVVTATLTDQNANITHGNSISVPYKKKWYEKPWLWGAAGFTAGILIK